LDNPQNDRLISSAHNAYMQGHYHRVPGLQTGEDESFPKDQYYNPPETELVASKVLMESDRERVEHREYRFTKIEVSLAKADDGQWREVDRDLVALRLNPWWYPHGIYAPSNAGGPFTIGRVIHSSRGVGFTGWIGGVAVFNRALAEAELRTLSAFNKGSSSL
jgi:hypothetical protein